MWVVDLMTKVIFSIHMTDTNDSWGSGSVGKRYKWHMHMTKEVVGVVAVMTDGTVGYWWVLGADR